MGKNSSIEWTHHTFNPWWGCVKVSAGCKNCYAEAWSKRVGAKVWGKVAGRRFFGDGHWQQPRMWNREAENAGERRRVFCASMADVFEERRELNAWREKLWTLIGQTPWLDWLLLTKRPENASSMVPWSSKWPANIWLGTTVENQLWANKRIPTLLETYAKVRFLSCEPMLGPIDLSRWLLTRSEANATEKKLHWVIAGGESGHGARPMRPEWVRYLRDQCTESRVAFHFKQWGNWRPVDAGSADGGGGPSKKNTRTDFEFLSKAKAGRDLDGKEWDEFPVPER